MGSVLFWIVAALLLFWAVGAHGRLSRLRTGVAQAFGGVDGHLQNFGLLLQTYRAQLQAVDPTLDEAPAQHALQLAHEQFVAALAAARQRPLEVERIEQLARTRDGLSAAWTAALTQHELPHQDLAPGPWQTRWTDLALQGEPMLQQHAEAVIQYNQAIAQFPASMLAALLGFSSARGL